MQWNPFKLVPWGTSRPGTVDQHRNDEEIHWIVQTAQISTYVSIMSVPKSFSFCSRQRTDQCRTCGWCRLQIRCLRIGPEKRTRGFATFFDRSRAPGTMAWPCNGSIDGSIHLNSSLPIRPSHHHPSPSPPREPLTSCSFV